MPPVDNHRHREFGGCQVVRGYAVHLLFHLLAAVAGCACGVAAGLWWFASNPAGLWLFLSALAVGGVVLVLQALCITVADPRDPRPRQRERALLTSTRPDLEPVAPAGSAPTRVVNGASPALGRRWRSYPNAGRS